MKHAAVYSLLDPGRSEDILQLTAYPLEKELAQYKQKCLNYIKRMESNTAPKQFLDYGPIR
jgi:hypothetical protein